MSKYRKLTTVCCAAVLALGLAACGSSDDDTAMMPTEPTMPVEPVDPGPTPDEIAAGTKAAGTKAKAIGKVTPDNALGATAALPWGFTVGGTGMLRWTAYEGDWFPNTAPGQSRSDLTRTVRLFAHNRALTLEGFSPQVSVTQEQGTTNAQLYDYGRIFDELRFVRLF